MRLFDCFIFNDELDVLEIRLRELGDVVDRFVLVEASETQSGRRKPFYFEENRSRFAPYLEKIVHVSIDFPDCLPPARGKRARERIWEREHYQRDQIARGLAEAAPSDLVLISDVDEIVRADALAAVRDSGRAGDRLTVFELTTHRFHLDLFYPDETCLLCSRLLEKRHLSTPQLVRMAQARISKRRRYPDPLGQALLRLRNRVSSGIGLPVEIVPQAGWHFSSMGDLAAFRRKLGAVTEGPMVTAAGVEAAYRRFRQGLAPYPRERLPACVASGDFDHLLAAAPSG
ncbi:glycosyltransferase family 17 protein [Afifella pfennigii]|uniref:hypothetical protein n=1 Tax=Afifella pfennigii TaxID=209897 RepID=UPI00068EE584|nr:hypothetical protein [Afifella pfennigii]